MSDGETIETLDGPMTVRVLSSYAAVSIAHDLAKDRSRTWESVRELWLWPNDPRIKRRVTEFGVYGMSAIVCESLGTIRDFPDDFEGRIFSVDSAGFWRKAVSDDRR